MQGGPLFTFTVITVEAHPTFAQIHHRMPAILDGQGVVRDWLDPSRSTKEVCDLLHPVDCLHWHPVSTVVNNSRNHSAECVIPFDTRYTVLSGTVGTSHSVFFFAVSRPLARRTLYSTGSLNLHSRVRCPLTHLPKGQDYIHHNKMLFNDS